MKIIGNCSIYGEANCPYLRYPLYHAGFTGKSGEETWFYCARQKKPIRHIKKCELAGNAKAQSECSVLLGVKP